MFGMEQSIPVSVDSKKISLKMIEPRSKSGEGLTNFSLLIYDKESCILLVNMMKPSALKLKCGGFGSDPDGKKSDSKD